MFPTAADEDLLRGLLGELWASQQPDAISRGEVLVPDAWTMRALGASLAGRSEVRGVRIASSLGIVRLCAIVSSSFGTYEARMGVAPADVRVGPEVRRVILEVREPLSLSGAGPAGLLAGVVSLPGIRRKLLESLLSRVPGASWADDRIALDLSRIPAAEAWLMRPVLGRPACHFLRVDSATPVAGGIVLRLSTGLGAS
ncbi:MAG: hypothetical protein L0216_13375 [Planctomycetales bacterium]|nr:hypothetical protein [Planctomycetales bacterium]